jgi:heat shock protein 5
MFPSFQLMMVSLRSWLALVIPILVEDFDNRVIGHFVKMYKKIGTDVSSNLRAMGKLKREVEKTMRTLSSQQSTRLEIESFEGGNDFSETLCRCQEGGYQRCMYPLFTRRNKP